MFKSLRVPEGLFRLLTWVVSFVFAGFLIGLGGRIIADMPRLETPVELDRFADQTSLSSARNDLRTLEVRARELSDQRDQAGLAFTAVSNAYQSARASYTNWIQTRTATTDPSQDPEVLSRTRELDKLKASERALMTTGDVKPDFCVHCGLKLFDSCPTCETRRNVFFHYCPKCGAPAPAIAT